MKKPALITSSIVLTYSAVAAAQQPLAPQTASADSRAVAPLPPEGAPVSLAPPSPSAELPPVAPEGVSQPTPKIPAPPTGSFMLRPLAPVTALRLDSLVAGYNAAPGPAAAGGHSGGWIEGSILTAMYRISPEFGVSARVGEMSNHPSTSPSGTTLASPMVIGTYALALEDWRLAFGLGISVPIGSGRGNTPDPGVALANMIANYARSAYDGPLFNPNSTYITPSAEVAYVAHGLTVHYDLALSQAFRVQGELKTPDSAVTTLLTGLHVGYFIVPMFSIGLETRYQRFLTTFTPCTKNDSLCDNWTIAEGARFHFRSGQNTFHPGISLTQGLRGALNDQGFEVVQLDLPVSF